ncbi:Calx-beta domain-containing protein [Actinokineospora sp.]|uniref:Calx-beta domain-containing protein n=1 Tax=Actinokineospora sp. TaxID=1872133 RepID=UPI0040382B7B
MKSLVKGLLSTVVVIGALVAVVPGATAAGCTTTVGVNNVFAHEGSNGGSTLMTFTVSATTTTGCDANGSVAWKTLDGTATVPGGDYAAGDGVLYWTGQSVAKTVTVEVFRDVAPEDDENFTVVLSNPVGVTIDRSRDVGIGIVGDDDGRVWGPVVVDIQGGKVCWTPHACKVTVSINAVANAPVTVSVSTVDGTAKAGVDFVGIDAGLVTIPAGKNAAAVTVQLLPDERGERVEEFGLVISDPSTGTIGNPKSTVTVIPQQ